MEVEYLVLFRHDVLGVDSRNLLHLLLIITTTGVSSLKKADVRWCSVNNKLWRGLRSSSSWDRVLLVSTLLFLFFPFTPHALSLKRGLTLVSSSLSL